MIRRSVKELSSGKEEQRNVRELDDEVIYLKNQKMKNTRLRAFLQFYRAYPRCIFTEPIISFCGNMREDVNLVETGPKNSELLQSINDKLNDDAFI